MADEYRYNLIQATPFIVKAIDHLTSSENRKKLPKALREELDEWKSRESGDELEKGVTCGQGVKVISFPLLQDIQEQLKILPLNGRTPFLHELLQGSCIVFPWRQALPRNPELVARLKAIQKSLDNEEYSKMVFGAKRKNEAALLQDFKLDVQATHRQLWVFFNFVFTVVGSFIFGYFAAYYAGMDTVTCYLIALIIGLMVFFADLYFLMKNL